MLVDKSAEKIVKRLSNRRCSSNRTNHYQPQKTFTVRHVQQKKQREQFEVMSYKRSIDLLIHS
jgi:ribosomal protein S10